MLSIPPTVEHAPAVERTLLEPMQLGSMQLSSQERARRREEGSVLLLWMRGVITSHSAWNDDSIAVTNSQPRPSG